MEGKIHLHLNMYTHIHLDSEAQEDFHVSLGSSLKVSKTAVPSVMLSMGISKSLLKWYNLRNHFHSCSLRYLRPLDFNTHIFISLDD